MPESQLIKFEPTELLADEKAVYEAEQQFLGDFVRLGAALGKLRDNQSWSKAGFKSWDAYCKSGRIDHTKRHADRLIHCSRISKYLPEFPTELGHKCPKWLVTHVCEFARLETPKDVKRVAGKVVTRIKNGSKLTVNLVREAVDADLGTPLKKQIQRAEALRQAETIADEVINCTSRVRYVRSYLLDLTDLMLEDAERDKPGCLKELLLELGKTAALAADVRERCLTDGIVQRKAR